MSERRRNRREQGSGSIYKRKSDGRWVSVVDLGWIDGKRTRKSYVSRTEQEATAKLNKALGEHGRGLLMPANTATVEQFLTSWLETNARHNIRQRTYDSYLETINKYIVPAIGRHRLDKLKPQHVQVMINDMIAKKFSARSIHRHRAVLRSALNDARMWGMVQTNVATMVRLPSVRQFSGNVLSPEEAKQLINGLEGDPLEAMIMLTLSLGLRQGEVLGLRWKDVSLENRELFIRQQYNARLHIPRLTPEKRMELSELSAQDRASFHLERFRPRFGEPKTDRSRRPLPLPSMTIEALKRHKVRQNQDRLLAGERWVDLGLVFPSTVGTPLEPSRVLIMFREAFDKAGVPRRQFHDLRRSCASLLAAWSVPPSLVRDILGHSDISTTMNVYTRTYSNDMRDALDRMDDLQDDVKRGAK